MRTRRCFPPVIGIRPRGACPGGSAWIDDSAYDADGIWWIDVTRTGRYQVELRAYPREAERAMGAANASLRIGADAWNKDALTHDACVRFDVTLDAGLTRLGASICAADGNRRRGAYYVYVSKL